MSKGNWIKGRLPRKRYMRVCKECGKKFKASYQLKRYCEDCEGTVSPRYEYVVRLTTKGNRTGDNYAITIPRKIIEEYNLFHKKFKMRVSPFGKFILYTKLWGEQT